MLALYLVGTQYLIIKYVLITRHLWYIVCKLNFELLVVLQVSNYSQFNS